jgi:hypothetical protein
VRNQRLKPLKRYAGSNLADMGRIAVHAHGQLWATPWSCEDGGGPEEAAVQAAARAGTDDSQAWRQAAPVGIATARDRVAQAALKLVLEPIFEADFHPCSYGFRPMRRVSTIRPKTRSQRVSGGWTRRRAQCGTTPWQAIAGNTLRRASPNTATRSGPASSRPAGCGRSSGSKAAGCSRCRRCSSL